MLLTRAPLYLGRSPFSLDLHVLGTPLAFVLSQDQTLRNFQPGRSPALRLASVFLTRCTFLLLPDCQGANGFCVWPASGASRWHCTGLSRGDHGGLACFALFALARPREALGIPTRDVSVGGMRFVREPPPPVKRSSCT